MILRPQNPVFSRKSQLLSDILWLSDARNAHNESSASNDGLSTRIYLSNHSDETGLEMKKYVRGVCGYIHDRAQGEPDSDIIPRTAFEELLNDWACPVCGTDKNEFSPEG
jgi:rubredoxin